MSIVIKEAHPAPRSEALNEEWMILENAGPAPLHLGGVMVTRSPKRTERGRVVATISPGFLLKVGERVRLVTGSAGKKAHGSPPPEEEGVRNCHLLLNESLLGKAGVVRLLLRQLELCSVATDGMGAVRI